MWRKQKYFNLRSLQVNWEVNTATAETLENNVQQGIIKCFFSFFFFSSEQEFKEKPSEEGRTSSPMAPEFK